MNEKKLKESKTRSKRTTSSTSTRNGLTGQVICEIITTCGESGVKSLSFQGLDLTFQARDVEKVENVYPQSPGPVTAILPKDLENIIKPDMFAEKDDEIAELKIQDPLQYEEFLAQGELE